MNQVQYQLQKMFKKMDPKIVYVAGAVLLAAMIWASPILFLRDSILGKVAMVASIIALTLYHRVAGIIALIVIIAIMQKMKVTEGFELPISTPVSSTSLPSSSSSSSSGTWNTPDEFKQKFCMKALVEGSNINSLVDVLNPNSKLFNFDSSGKITDAGESYNRIDWGSLLACGTYKNPINGTDQSGGFVALCDPKCNWKIKTEAKKEGFVPMLRPHMRNVEKFVTDKVDTLKESVNTLQRKIL